MLDIVPLEKRDANLIVEWNADKSADFLQQWAGLGYTFPITEKQIIDRIDANELSNYKIYKIILDDSMIGTIELMNIDHSTNMAKIGRFIINPKLTGMGYGTAALKMFVNTIFEEMDFTVIHLSVFDFNQRAFRCYEKAGFETVGKSTRPNGWVAIDMQLDHHRLKAGGFGL